MQVSIKLYDVRMLHKAMFLMETASRTCWDRARAQASKKGSELSRMSAHRRPFNTARGAFCTDITSMASNTGNALHTGGRGA